MAGRVLSRRGRRTATRRDDHGVIAVEFALIIPLLIALMSGIITAGLGYNQVLGQSQGVHEGARFGATTPTTVPGGWGATVQAQTVTLSYLNSGDITSTMVCAQLVNPSGTAIMASSCDPVAGAAPGTPANLGTSCVVKVWATIPVTLKFVIIPDATIQVLRQSVALYERGSGATCT